MPWARAAVVSRTGRARRSRGTAGSRDRASRWCGRRSRPSALPGARRKRGSRARRHRPRYDGTRTRTDPARRSSGRAGGSAGHRCWRPPPQARAVARLVRREEPVGIEREAQRLSSARRKASLSSRSTRAPIGRDVHSRAGGAGPFPPRSALARSSETSRPRVLPSRPFRSSSLRRTAASMSIVVRGMCVTIAADASDGFRQA